MNVDYNLLVENYISLIEILKKDNREVSKEMIQTIRDDIEDILIILGKVSQLQPKLCEKTIGYKI